MCQQMYNSYRLVSDSIGQCYGRGHESKHHIHLSELYTLRRLSKRTTRAVQIYYIGFHFVNHEHIHYFNMLQL